MKQCNNYKIQIFSLLWTCSSDPSMWLSGGMWQSSNKKRCEKQFLLLYVLVVDNRGSEISALQCLCSGVCRAYLLKFTFKCKQCKLPVVATTQTCIFTLYRNTYFPLTCTFPLHLINHCCWCYDSWAEGSDSGSPPLLLHHRNKNISLI